MTTKICILCNTEKELSEYYKHLKMPNGVDSKCKKCVKARAKKREEKLRLDPVWVEKEKVRAKEKYQRLGYKEKQKEWDANKPWKNTSAYKNQNRDYNIPKGYDIHHWNYSLIKDFFILKKSEHKKAHKFLLFDNENLFFNGLELQVLDTKQKHIDYLISKGINIGSI